MRLPSIHLNGTSQGDLHQRYMAAYKAVEAALEALRQAYPNGRDYYPQGAEAGAEAMREHDARCMALRKVKDELEQLVCHVMA